MYYGLLLYFYDSQGYYEGYYLLEVFLIGGNLTELCLCMLVCDVLRTPIFLLYQVPQFKVSNISSAQQLTPTG